jgi:aldehyde dehydrogenase
MAQDDEFLDKAVEGLVLFAFNKGEVCTSPSRALVQEDIYEAFMARCLKRIAAITQGDPLDTDTQLGPQVSAQQIEKIASYVEIGRNEGAEVLIGGERTNLDGEFADGYFFQPTVLKGDNRMRVFQEEIFGPVLAVTTFKDDAEALAIANDTLYGLGAGVWTATAPAPTRWAAPSRRAGCGRTAITSTPLGPRSADTRSPASAGRTTG